MGWLYRQNLRWSCRTWSPLSIPCCQYLILASSCCLPLQIEIKVISIWSITSSYSYGEIFAHNNLHPLRQYLPPHLPSASANNSTAISSYVCKISIYKVAHHSPKRVTTIATHKLLLSDLSFMLCLVLLSPMISSTRLRGFERPHPGQ